MSISLAVKYRPKTWDDVTEQGNVRQILSQQLLSGEIKNAYLFCGGAGTGKTTCARIFANEINKGVGTPMEMDAASHNSVEDVRDLNQRARKKPLEGEYNVFILDECHVLSNAAWQAMLKLLEEPPAMSIFIFCTTNPEKIPKTILSRVQRYDFQRISQQGIIDRLQHIFLHEHAGKDYYYDKSALEYIAKIADGGMRDAITLLDKCLAYNDELTTENVVAAVGAVDYDVMLNLTDALIYSETKTVLDIIEEMYAQGKDLKMFLRDYTSFVLDLCKFNLTGGLEYTKLPETYLPVVKKKLTTYFDDCSVLLKLLLRLNNDVKWDNSPKSLIEANLFQFCLEGK